MSMGTAVLNEGGTRRWAAAVLAAATLVALAAALLVRAAEGPPPPGSSAVGSLIDKPPVPITRPLDAATQPASAPSKLRRLEGTTVLDAACRLVYDKESGWHVLEFVDQPHQPFGGARRVLPCALLEAMEKAILADPDQIFRVSGETTFYEDRLYLLPQVVVAVAPAATPASAPAAGPAPEQPPKRETPATTPASAPAATSDVFDALFQGPPATPVLAPSTPPAPAPREALTPPAGAARDRPLPAEGTSLIINRSVRIVPTDDGFWREARFVSDNTLRDPPLRLLPCRTLQFIQEVTQRVLASGQVTRYRGRAYLLLRKAIPQRNMRQF